MKLEIDLGTGQVAVDGENVEDITLIHVEIPHRVRFYPGFASGFGNISRSEISTKSEASGASCTIIKERWGVERYFPENG